MRLASPPMGAATGHRTLTPEQAATAARALAHTARLAILEKLAACGECKAGEIADAADLAQSTVSEHLRILREAGLITATRDGPRIWYSLDRDALEAFLESVRHLTCAR